MCFPMTDKKLRIGFIGNGRSANRYHIPYLLVRQDKFHIKTIYARNLEKSVWKRVPGIAYIENLAELLDDPEIDLIVVSTPLEGHFDLVRRVLEAGKNCVCEKPFTFTAAQAEELFSLARRRGVMLQSYQNRRFDSDFLTAQRVIETGKLGDIFEVEMHFDYYRPEVPASVKQFDPAHTFLFGYGCHMLDQAISYFGIPEDVHYDVRQILGRGRMNDYFDLDLFCGNKKIIISSSYFRVKSRPSITVYGTRGTFLKESTDKQEQHLKMFYFPGQPGFGVDQPSDYGVLSYYDGEGIYHEERVISETGDYGRYYDSVYQTIMCGAAPLVRPEETIEQIRILEAGLKGIF